MGESSRQKLYNQSIQDAYNVLLNQKRASRSSATIENDENEEEPTEMSEFSDSEGGYSDDLIQEDEFLAQEEDEEYSRFKKSVIHDQVDDDYGWLDDDEDTDYTEEADQSFIQDNGESSYSSREGSVLHEISSKSFSGKWLLIGIITTALIWFMVSPSSRLENIERELKHTGMGGRQDQGTNSLDLDSNIKVIIQQFEKNIKRILPKYMKKLEMDVADLESKVQKIDQRLLNQNITQWEKDLITNLNDKLPEKIPIVMENDTGMLLIPELHDYLSAMIGHVVRQSVTSLPQFDFNLNDYVKEVLKNNFQCVDKQTFLDQLQGSLFSTKKEILEELESRLSHVTNSDSVSQQYSSVLIKKLVHRIYNANQHQWESDLNFATLAQGTNLLNHLCSKTHHGPVGPVDLLQDCTSCTSTYWNCQPTGCTWAIRFSEPMFLTKLGYIHGKFSHNLHVMAAAPKTIRVYVKLNEVKRRPPSNFEYWSKSSSFIALGSWDYDIFDSHIRQDFELPQWFIQAKMLVRAVAFEVVSNHGNQKYTSLKKFVINAVTPQDLQLMDKFPQDWKTKVPDYSVMIDEKERLRASLVAKRHDADKVPSFGDDEIDT
ncbi:HGL178Cp [Eremothecium sinecaudum]|uniref:HGL178Cp n=1 Tax=Eremothecium sinecaudum TaxID=45286 RepID=A0A0X8HV89_9SACH|nr:HGL178Cp [Eremothecium sinecaudum]AMD22162.1 HGL178Cp [Eremothecium sinecaudum]